MLILITGASGSGTSTLGKALADQLGFAYFDTDDYYWHSTQPPFAQTRDNDERLALLLSDLRTTQHAIVGGSVMDWGAELEDCFDLIVFLYLDASVRIERLRKRELERFGRVDPEFIEWAVQYDAGPAVGRSLPKHRTWLSARRCPVLEISGDFTVSERLQTVLKSLPNSVLERRSVLRWR
jgi:uridine kinase